MEKIKTAEEWIKDKFNQPDTQDWYKPVLECMEIYASQFKQPTEQLSDIRGLKSVMELDEKINTLVYDKNITLPAYNLFLEIQQLWVNCIEAIRNQQPTDKEQPMEDLNKESAAVDLEMDNQLNFIHDSVRCMEFDLGFKTGYVTAYAKVEQPIQDNEDKLPVSEYEAGFNDGKFFIEQPQDNEAVEWKEECDRLEKIIKFWRDKYYEVCPPTENPKIDDDF